MKFINNNKIQELIASGVLIEEKAAQKLSLMDNNKLNIVINKINIKKPTILTESLLLSYFPQPVKIIKEFNVIKPKSIQEFVNAINLKYTSLQNVLIQKTDIKNIVSIKNIGNEHCIIIGMIRKVNDAPEKMYVEIEDPTGSIFVNMSKNSFYSKIREDDVVAISGKKVGNIFEAEDIVWPDVPLRTATVGNGKMLFLSGQTLNDKICELIMDADYIFVHNCAGWEAIAKNSSAQWVVVGNKTETNQNVTFVTNPCMLEVGGLLLLIYFGQEHVSDALRRRFISISGTDFIIDPVPDIVFASVDSPTNYKGITIISNGRIDAESRDATPL